MTIVDAARTVAPLLRDPALAARWHDPSALAEFRVSGLAGHLVRAVLQIPSYLDDEVPAGAPTMSAAAYFVDAVGSDDVADLSSHRNRSIRDHGEHHAVGGWTDLADTFDAALADVTVRLDGIPLDRPVRMHGRYVLTLGECLKTRMVEMVVHADDLAVSLGIPTPAFEDDTADAVVAVLAQTARRRFDTTQVVRALARRERARREPLTAF